VISAPHGGYLEPPSVANRTYGTTVQDRNTQQMARALADAYALRTGRRPHVVISHLHRRKLDPNREVVEAAQGDPTAIQAWTDYHGFIDQAKAVVTSHWGRGLYVDVHGHGHPEGWVELGYALSGSELGLPDATLNQPQYVNRSTLRALASRPGVTFAEALRGATSLGGMLEAGGYRSVPSPGDPSPAGGNYFSGGYSVQRHGSMGAGTVDGVQAELPFSIRQDQGSRAAFAALEADAIERFMARYQSVAGGQDPLVSIVAVDRFASEAGGDARFEVRRQGFLALPLTVSLHWSGSAGASDVVLAGGGGLPAQVTVPAMAASVELVVVAVDDTVAEGAETLRVALGGGTLLGSPAVAEAVILDDDGAPDLVLSLPCDDGAGNVALDASGNGRAGSLMGGAVFGGGAPALPLPPNGATAAGVLLDGRTAYLRIADAPYAASGDFTWTLWFRVAPFAGGADRAVLSHGAAGQPNRLTVTVDAATGFLRTDLAYANDLSAASILDVDRDFRDGQWHHFALMSGPNRLSQVAVDGVLAAEGWHHGDALDPIGDVVLGARADLAAGTFLPGAIDGIAAWSRALSLAELALLVPGPPVAGSVGFAWSESALLPGSAEDLELALGVASAPGARPNPVLGPGRDVAFAGAGDAVELVAWSPTARHAGGFGAIVAELVPAGPAPGHPLFPQLYLSDNGALVLAGPAPLAPAVSWAWTVPTGLLPARALVQAIALDPRATNGAFAASGAVELRLR